MNNSDIPEYVKSFENMQKDIKDEIFRISWYMRGGVNSQDLFHIYGYEDRQILNQIIKENIETTKKTQMPIL